MPETRKPSRTARRVAWSEALIIPAVLAALAAGAGTGVMSARADADLRAARSTAHSLAQVAEAYRLLRGADVCPSVRQIEDSKLLHGLKAEDPWGMRYQVLCEDRRVRVRSLGPDRRPGTADDIAPE